MKTIVKEKTTIRTAAYIRVSTEHEDQEYSFEAQKKYFQKILENNEHYENAGIYSDCGLSGTSVKSRDGMRSLLLDCRRQ